jgi:CheY-like chemotaxis protein
MDPQAAIAPPARSPSVLLVDDDRDTLDMYATFLEMSGLRVATSRTLSEALASVSKDRPDLVVTDLGFAGRSDGARLVHAVKQRPDTRDVPVIVLSGQSADQMPADVVGTADLCLVKPVLPDVLLSDAQRLITHARTARERRAADRPGNS